MSLLSKMAKESRLNKPASPKDKPLWTGAAAVFNYTEKLANQHTLKDKFGGDYVNYRVTGHLT